MAASNDWTDNIKGHLKLDGTIEEQQKIREVLFAAMPEEMKFESMSDKYAYLDEDLDDE